MFTGIVEEVGRISSIKKLKSGEYVLSIKCKKISPSTLSIGDSETITLAADTTSLSFDTIFADTATYEVTVASQPTGLVCSITNASGIISAVNIDNVAVNCATGYSVSGTIEGLNGETATLSLN